MVEIAKKTMPGSARLPRFRKDSRILPDEEIYHRLRDDFNLAEEEINQIKEVTKTYPMKISEYYFNLIDHVGDPIWNQCIPSIKEIQDQEGEEDPLAEERDSPIPLITHRYPDRVLFLISETCDMYCRFCTRKRKVGTDRLTITFEKIDKSVEYIASHPEIRDVILSGGDGLDIPLSRLDYILNAVHSIPHVEIIRIGTRLPCTNPHKITPELCNTLRKYHPLYINVHFENPMEITEESSKACMMLADAGIPLGNQNVLLETINNNPLVMGELYKKLLRIRVKPYYLFQADFVKGTNHFRTPVEDGVDIIHKLRGFISGLAIPHYVIDAPNGGGKIPLIPEYLQYLGKDKVELKNYKGVLCEYPQKQE